MHKNSNWRGKSIEFVYSDMKRRAEVEAELKPESNNTFSIFYFLSSGCNLQPHIFIIAEINISENIYIRESFVLTTP